VEIHTTSNFPEGSYTQDLRGNELYGLTDLRDDTAIAVVGAAALLAILFLTLGRGPQFAAVVITLSGAAVCALAGYGALHDWRSDYAYMTHVFIDDVDSTLALWVSLALCMVLSLTGIRLFFRSNGTTSPELQTGAGQA